MDPICVQRFDHKNDERGRLYDQARGGDVWIRWFEGPSLKLRQ